MKVGLFGGSFDPFHEGHEHLLFSALKENVFDEIIIIPNFQSPHKNKSDNNIKKRLHILQEKLPSLQKKISLQQKNCCLKLSLIECERKSYTIDTLRSLKKENPENHYWLLIGSDSFFSLHTWKSFDEVLTQCKLCVIKRDQKTKKEYKFYAKEILKIENSHWHCCKNKANTTSSSLLKMQNESVIIGICGRVGSGKSTALNILSKALNARAIELDLLGHEILIQHHALFIKYFGSDIQENNKIDRKKLGKLIFHNEEKRKILNALSHPFIKQSALQKINKKGITLICGALLFEIELANHCHSIINIDAPSQEIIKKIGKKFKPISKTQLSKNQFIKKCPITVHNTFNNHFKKNLKDLAQELLHFKNFSVQ